MSQISPIDMDSRREQNDNSVLNHFLTSPLVITTTSSNDKEEDEGYVPESLVCFVNAFDTALEEAKQSFFETAQTPKVLKQDVYPQNTSKILDDSDLLATPIPNPANLFTASGAKRELQIDTKPRVMKENHANRLLSTDSTTSFSNRKDSHKEDSNSSKTVPTIVDFNDMISPIANIKSPRCSSSPHTTRQKLFPSPRLEQRTTPDRAKLIQETVEQVSENGDSSSNTDTKDEKRKDTSSSPTRLSAGMSASKRRTQFIKARKSVASKRGGNRQQVLNQHATTLLEETPSMDIISNPSPCSPCTLMEETVIDVSPENKPDVVLSPASSANRSCVGQPMAETIRDSFSVASDLIDPVVIPKVTGQSKIVVSKNNRTQEKENRTFTQTNRIKKSALDERIAAARERARQRILEKEALLAERIASKSKSSLPTQPMVTRDRQRIGPRTAPVNAKIRAEKNKVTIPQSPKFATNSKLGVKKPVTSVSMEVSLAQSTDVLRKGLRNQEPVTTRLSRRGLTIPKTPKFATDNRLKQRFVTPAPSVGVMTLAQSNDMHRRGLRAMTAPISKRPNGLTIPKSPKFQTSTKRALPKSTAEKEAEVMNYYKSHPFKAAPIIKEFPQQKSKPKVPPRKLTNPIPFKLRTDIRGTSAPHQPVSVKAQEDEAEFKFHARPMPNYSRRPVNASSKKKELTKPVPFRLSSSPRGKPNDEAKVIEARFRAKPVPKTTYEYRPPPKTPPRSTIELKPPELATAKRSEKHNAIIQLSRARAEALSAEKEAMQKARQREQLKEALKKANLLTPRSASKFEKVTPFELQSTQRHANYLKEMEEKKRQATEERLKQMEFHARSFHPSPAPKPIQSPRTPTQFEPFNVSCNDYVEIEKEAARKRLLQKEEERKAKAHVSPFKARPVPSTTYFSPSSLASKSSPRVSTEACRTPTCVSPSKKNDVMEQSHDHSSISEMSDSRSPQEDEIEIEFMECHSHDGDIGPFLST